MTSLKKLTKTFFKLTILEKLFYSLALTVIFIIIINYSKPITEGFDKKNTEFYSHKENIYDQFYVDIYDDLVFAKHKNDFEIKEIIDKTSPNNNSLFLDIGSGTGHHIASLDAHGYKGIGLDKSSAMINKSKETYPDLNYKLGDVLNSMTFSPNTFTHITCLYFTIYYIQDKQLFFNNVMSWLKPGGYLVIHLVDRDNFDPILPGGDPFLYISPQNYTDKRITNTNITFKNDMKYKANFEYYPQNDTSVLKETFKFKDGNIRQQEHKFFMPTQKKILSLAKNVGFKLIKKIDLLPVQYENQYLYILQKPN